MASAKTETTTLDRGGKNTDLYERDFYVWVITQTKALRENRWADLDWENLAEEIESVGRNDQRAILRHLEVLLAHLLKCLLQPERRTRSWDLTIRSQRERISMLLERNPSLRDLPDTRFEKTYRRAVHLAGRDTGLDEGEFPATPPYTLEQVLSAEFLPPQRKERS